LSKVDSVLIITIHIISTDLVNYMVNTSDTDKNKAKLDQEYQNLISKIKSRQVSLSEEEKEFNESIDKLTIDSLESDTKQDRILTERARVLIIEPHSQLLITKKFDFLEIPTERLNLSPFLENAFELISIHKLLSSDYVYSFKLLEEFNKTGKVKFYYEAIEKGLFSDIEKLSSSMLLIKNPEKDKNFSKIMYQEFASIVAKALNPIEKYRNDVLNNADKKVAEKSQNILSTIAQKIINVRPYGRPKKLPSPDTPFGISFKQLLKVLYGMLKTAFKDVKKYINPSEKRNHFNANLNKDLFVNLDMEELFRLEPNKAAKKVICSFFEISEKSLQQYLRRI